MSFKEYDKKHTITSENYEEFFLLYVDGELNEADRKQVDDFVIHHPDLKTELDILLSTRLSPDNISINKEELFSFSMNKVENEEMLLSFIDGEVSEDEKRKIEENINAIGSLKKEYELLLKTKLDPTEIITYPNKEELYKKTRRTIPFTPWLRAAAIIILLAGGFVIYEKQSRVGTQPSTEAITQTPNKRLKQNNTNIVKDTKPAISNENIVKSENIAVLNPTSTNKKVLEQHKTSNDTKTSSKVLIAKNELPKEPNQQVKHVNEKLEINTPTPLIAYVPTTETINNSPVTSALSKRTIMVAPLQQQIIPEPPIAKRSDHKGSFKSLLRKAARVIEKKTGIDPANDNDELLIGALAVKIN